MLTDENKKHVENLKLSNEEIKQFSDFRNVDEKYLDEIRELVFQFSLMLYKSNNDE